MWDTKYIFMQNICKTKANLSSLIVAEPEYAKPLLSETREPRAHLSTAPLQAVCRPRQETLTQFTVNSWFLDSLLIPWAQICYCNMAGKGSYCPNLNKLRFNDYSCCEA